jgi:hypothetical protein
VVHLAGETVQGRRAVQSDEGDSAAFLKKHGGNSGFVHEGSPWSWNLPLTDRSVG